MLNTTKIANARIDNFVEEGKEEVKKKAVKIKPIQNSLFDA
jgi:hypothetical protein